MLSRWILGARRRLTFIRGVKPCLWTAPLTSATREDRAGSSAAGRSHAELDAGSSPRRPDPGSGEATGLDAFGTGGGPGRTASDASDHASTLTASAAAACDPGLHTLSPSRGSRSSRGSDYGTGHRPGRSRQGDSVRIHARILPHVRRQYRRAHGAFETDAGRDLLPDPGAADRGRSGRHSGRDGFTPIDERLQEAFLWTLHESMKPPHSGLEDGQSARADLDESAFVYLKASNSFESSST